MKALLKIFIPMCVVSFIAFGISVAVFGTNDSVSDDEISIGDNSTVLTEDYEAIDIDVGAYDCTLKSGSGDVTTVYVSGDKADRIKAKVSGGTLKVYSDGKWFKFGFGFWNSSTSVTVEVPEKVYEELKVHTGAGDAYVKNISADSVLLDVSAGKLEYIQPEHVVSSLDVHVSAGKLIARNAASREYSVDVSAGNAEVYGLTGSGSIDVSAGSAKAYLAELNGSCDIDVSAGNATLGVPGNASARIDCSRSAGSIEIGACGIYRNADDHDVVTLNGGEYSISADVSAGSIKITNYDQNDSETATTAVNTVMDETASVAVEVTETDTIEIQ